MIHYTSNRFAGWAEALDVLHEDRDRATPQWEPKSSFSPSDLLPHQVSQIEQIRRMKIRPDYLAQPAVAPLRAVDIDAALLDYCLADLLFMEVMELLALELETPAPVTPSYPIASLPRALQPDPDPFRVPLSRALNRRPTCPT